MDTSKLSKATVIDRSQEGPVDVSSIIDASSLGHAKDARKKKGKKSRAHARDVLEEDISTQLGAFRSEDRPPRFGDDRPPRRDEDRPPRRDEDRPPRREGGRGRGGPREGGRGRGGPREGGRGRGGPREGGRGRGGPREGGRGRPAARRSNFDEAAEFPAL